MLHDTCFTIRFTNKSVYLQIVPHASGFDECKSGSKAPHWASDLSRKEFRAAGTAPKALAKKRFVTWNRGNWHPLECILWSLLHHAHRARCSWHTRHTAGRSISMKVWVMTSCDSNYEDQLADSHCYSFFGILRISLAISDEALK